MSHDLRGVIYIIVALACVMGLLTIIIRANR